MNMVNKSNLNDIDNLGFQGGISAEEGTTEYAIGKKAKFKGGKKGLIKPGVQAAKKSAGAVMMKKGTSKPGAISASPKPKPAKSGAADESGASAPVDGGSAAPVVASEEPVTATSGGGGGGGGMAEEPAATEETAATEPVAGDATKPKTASFAIAGTVLLLLLLLGSFAKSKSKTK